MQQQTHSGEIVESKDASYAQTRFDPVAKKKLPTGQMNVLWQIVIFGGQSETDYVSLKIWKFDRLDSDKTNPMYTKASQLKKGMKVKVVCDGRWDDYKHVMLFDQVASIDVE